MDFVNGAVLSPHEGRDVLDVGCGTGSLAVTLAKNGFRVVGVDLDAAMIERAVAKAQGLTNLHFRQMDMRLIGSHFQSASLDAILCFGNTLVHLEERTDVSLFFRSCRELLKPDGRLLLQILNYDYILAKRLPGLPTIENDRVRFERIYGYTDSGSIVFATVLHIKATGSVVRNEVFLYPLGSDEVRSLLIEAGFGNIAFYGGFGRSPLTAESLPLVAEARL